MTPFRERNPVPIALIGLTAILIVLFAAFNAQSLPLIGGGTTYYADFTDASNLQPNDDVRLAGVKIGSVESIALHGTVVRVAFRVKGTTLGGQSHAEIEIKTLLGQKYILIDSEGSGQLASGAVIPVTRTTTPFDVTTAFIGLAQHIEAINTTQLAQAFTTIASAFSTSPPEVKSSLVGLQRLSTTIASRDAVLTDLLGHAQNVTAELAARDAEVTKLINDGDLILQTLNEQSAVIHALLVNSAELASQLTALVAENRAALTPALTNLHSVITILQKDQFDLVNSVHLLAPFVRDFTNTLGNGEWFDTLVANLPPPSNQVQLGPQSSSGPPGGH
ncbi:MAG TPA: MCE family protein [Mycobacteriales bacterium]|nr:MCE family protein [Mycobacteriales bacterium]